VEAAERLLELGSKEVEINLYDEGTEYEWTCVSWSGTRHDPLLIAVIRELGERANGDCADLEIVEIEGGQYRVTEYDGAEGINTPEGIRWTEV
jgi:hypothetical protein